MMCYQALTPHSTTVAFDFRTLLSRYWQGMFKTKSKMFSTALWDALQLSEIKPFFLLHFFLTKTDQKKTQTPTPVAATLWPLDLEMQTHWLVQRSADDGDAWR